MTKKLLSFLLIASLLPACVTQNPSLRPTKTSQQLAIEALREGAIVIDVRTPEEFADGHLENAINIPYDQLEKRLAELNGQVDAPIVVYCKSGRRAGIAKKILEDHQFQRVWNGGGYLELNAQGVR